MQKDNITPKDSRYTPIQQQAYCCVPASILMVMYRLNIPLVPQELLGYYLGLIVPSEYKNNFFNTRVSDISPPAGYGTRIYLPEFELNTAFEKLKIPLKVEFNLINKISDFEAFRHLLKEYLVLDLDVLICLQWGALVDDPEQCWGHVVVVDKLEEDSIRFIDTDKGCKWKSFSYMKVYEAMMAHTSKNSGGLWVLKKR